MRLPLQGVMNSFPHKSGIGKIGQILETVAEKPEKQRSLPAGRVEALLRSEVELTSIVDVRGIRLLEDADQRITLRRRMRCSPTLVQPASRIQAR